MARSEAGPLTLRICLSCEFVHSYDNRSTGDDLASTCEWIMIMFGMSMDAKDKSIMQNKR
jgi:hypothetical protein